MEKFNTIRRIDELNKVVLPIEATKSMGWERKDSLMLTIDKNAGMITLQMYEKSPIPKCIICGSEETTAKVGGKDICLACLELVKSA